MRADVREKTQVGVELIGENSAEADAEVVGLFIEALKVAGVSAFTVSLAPVGVLRALVAASGGSQTWQTAVLGSFHASNFVEIDQLTSAWADEPALNARVASAIRALSRVRGNGSAISEARAIAEQFVDFPGAFDERGDG